MEIFGIKISGLKEQLSRGHNDLAFDESNVLEFIDNSYLSIFNSSNNSIIDYIIMHDEIYIKELLKKLTIEESTKLNTLKLNTIFEKDTKEAKVFALKIYKLNSYIDSAVEKYFEEKNFSKNISKIKNGVHKILN